MLANSLEGELEHVQKQKRIADFSDLPLVCIHMRERVPGRVFTASARGTEAELIQAWRRQVTTEDGTSSPRNRSQENFRQPKNRLPKHFTCEMI
jgi:hypothetical protein